MSDRDELIKKLEQLSKDKKISPYDKGRILKMPTEKAIKMDIIANTVIREEIQYPEPEDLTAPDLDDNQILRHILIVQKQQLDTLEKTRKNTSIMVTWLIVIPIIIFLISIIVLSSLS